MTWLEPPTDAVEEALREALDLARARTGDEIARRRVWTHIASPQVRSRLRPWLTRLAVAGTLAGGAAGAVLVWPRTTGPETVAKVVLPAPPAPRVEPRDTRTAVFEGPAVVRTSARQRARLRLWGGAEADLEPNSVLSVDRERHASIQRGRVSLAVARQAPGHHFTVGAGPYTISVLGTRFQVRVAGESVGVDVDEGVVEVWRDGHAVRVEPGEAWTSPAPPPAKAAGRHIHRRRGKQVALREAAPSPHPLLRPTPPPVMPSSGPFREAQAALAEGHSQRAVEILEAAARGDGPEAENAAYEVGWILRDHLLRPRQALSAWKRYRTRFPSGLLRAETDLSILETLLMVDDAPAALTEAQAFLASHPRSERRTEIAEIARRLRGEPGPAVSNREPGNQGTP